MNYLAHIYLSGTNEKLLIGNFIADSLKGADWKNYDDEVQKGIKLHHAIDKFTDTHHVVKKSKKRLWERYRHYNAVIVDIFYDHFLAANWKVHHNQDLGDFVDNTYNLLKKNHSMLPTNIQFLLKHMIKNNWLYNYQFVQGIENVMYGMSQRTSFNSGMENSTEDLIKYYEEFSVEFDSFFPLLKEFSELKISELK
jgi:acyl carrier protein phosphodiesterase